jgi:hypothetical protein
VGEKKCGGYPAISPDSDENQKKTQNPPISDLSGNQLRGLDKTVYCASQDGHPGGEAGQDTVAESSKPAAGAQPTPSHTPSSLDPN